MADRPKVAAKQYACVIIGGGPAGTSCAIKLAQLGIRDVLVVEASNYQKFQIGESLSPNCRPLLQELGLHRGFIQQKHDPCYGSLSYWGSDKRGYNDTIVSPLGHGWHLDRQKFNRLMADHSQHNGTTLLTKWRFNHARRQAQSYEISLSALDSTGHGEALITADTVIDASGARALFAHSQGAIKQHDRPLICSSARFQLNNHSQTVAKLTHIEAGQFGWWYGAPLPQGRLLISFTSTASIIKQQGLQDASVWFQQLQQTTWIRNLVEKASYTPDSFQCFNVPCFQQNKMYGPNWMAIGDAASSYDPITSAGIMKALSNGIMAAHAVQARLQGDSEGFSRAARSMKADYEYYQQMRQHYYLMEERWPESEFWRLLHTQEATAPS